jgi:membrane protease subunit HflK
MAWNTPGKGDNNDSSSGGSGGRNPWPPRKGGRGGRGGGGGGVDDILQRIGDFFGGGGGPLRWIPVVVALWLVFSCFVLITEQERGVVLRFGAYARTMSPGPGLKLPWPIESVTKVNATQSQAFSDSVPVFTSDGNIVTVELNVQYRVDNPQQFLFGTRDARQVLEQAALSAVREQVGRSDVDTVLNNRAILIGPITSRLQAALNVYQTGLKITEVNLQNARPPEQVKDAFDEAQRASADKQTAINQAQAYAAKVVPEARGEAARLRAGAIGYKTSLIARATGDAQRFSMLLQQYRGAPEVTRKRLWLEAVQEVLAHNRKVVGGDSRQLLYLQMPAARDPGTGAAASAPTPELIAPTVTSTPDDGNTRKGRGDGRGGSR